MKRKKGDDSGGVVLIAAPLGQDAVLAARVLEGAGISAKICERLSEVADRLDETTNAILVAAEALVASEISPRPEPFEKHPAWSEIPLTLLTSSGGGDEMSRRALEIFGASANVTLLE